MVQITNVYAAQTRSLSDANGQQTAQSLHLQWSIQVRRTYMRPSGQIRPEVCLFCHSYRSFSRSPTRPSGVRPVATG